MALWHAKEYGTMADKACWSLFAITSVIVSLRLFCRTRYGQGQYGGLGLDDYITTGCLAVALVTCVLVSIGSSHGLGRHMGDLTPEEIEQALKWNVIVSAVLIWSFSLPKFAIVAILKRILNYGPKTAVMLWGLAISSQACILGTSVWWFKQCSPVEYGWNKQIQGKCAPVSVLADLGYFTSAYSAFLDIFLALYPIPFIMRLNMPLKSRIAVSVALGLSVLACVVSIYKLAIFGSVFEVMAKDPTYPVPYLDILGVAEGCILMICASLPTLGPLLRLMTGKFSQYGSSPGRSGGQVQSNEGGHGGNWNSLKGHRLQDPETASTGVHSSVDDIPLVSSPKAPNRFDSSIHKTTEFTVTAERQL